ncbi:Pectate lyase superfamily protein [Serratia rubidaea]|uniref:Pectate lyase superfamily protein n=1 Tax=Serratia rubidaea TaxID=61652 RepID=A0A4U9H9R3_SERRU|nr:Pectate lyase superfamily protein [Serratia rubidaea]
MMSTALEENTGYFLSPEMFGAVGDGVHDDSDAIQTAIDHARVNKYRKVVGKGNYLINKTLLISSDGNGFALHLQSLIVGEQFPALPEKWWDAAPALAPHKAAAVKTTSTCASNISMAPIRRPGSETGGTASPPPDCTAAA